MSKPHIHALSSARKFGGVPEDYLDIHNLMDSSKSTIADNRHRALTHNSWFLFILEKIYGVTITNSDGKTVSVRDIGEQHILEDYGGRFIPSAQDFLQEIEFQPWMQNGEKGANPPSFRKLGGATKKRKIDFEKNEDENVAKDVPNLSDTKSNLTDFDIEVDISPTVIVDDSLVKENKKRIVFEWHKIP